MQSSAEMRDASVGVVVIGRNEGLRLHKCLQSLTQQAATIVYVDSGSTDGSIEFAQKSGAHVVQLDLATPFTAARARNVGFAELIRKMPQAAFVQFVDGDCEVDPKWIPTAREFLERHTDVGVVCGRRRERSPQASIYNAMCDIEWDTPVGEARYCGGDALMRAVAFAGVRGFREDLIAGEEPELCVRLRADGWRIWRLDAEMTLHDAAMLRFRQWWNRAKRAGYAFANGAYLHGAPPTRHWVREVRSACVWGGALPAFAASVSFWSPAAALAVLSIYPLQLARLVSRARPRSRENRYYAGFLLLGKFPEFLGIARFWLFRLARRRSGLIEYK
jgi:GT2 family glycosyltransferase